MDVQGSANGEVQMDYMKRKDQLDQKEKELNAREALLSKQEKDLLASGALKPKKNWPRCYPITYHDIAGDVSTAFSTSRLQSFSLGSQKQV